MNLLDHISFNRPSSHIRDCHQQQWSYEKLNEERRRWEILLGNYNLPPYSRIVLYSEKSNDLLAALLAVLGHSLVYVPVSRQNPLDRLSFILEDAEASLMITDDPDCLTHFRSQISVHSHSGSVGLYVLHFAGRNASVIQENLAGILYTSGSTGHPKGVALSHEAMWAFVNWCKKEFALESNDHIASIAPFNFDLSVFDLYAGLSSGCSVTLFDDKSIKNPMLLSMRLSEYGCSIVYSTPTLFNNLAQFGKMHKYNLRAIRLILFAGEVYMPSRFSLLREKLPHAVYYNLYGPTESNVCTYYRLKEADFTDSLADFPIGVACPYSELLLLADGQESAISPLARGELMIAGESMFTSYWNQTEKTKNSEYVAVSGKPYYRSGDWVEVDAEGQLHYIARIDRMIKRRGYRIELPEIEQIMSHHPAIIELAAVAVRDSNNEWKIVICYASAAELSHADLKEYCKSHFPEYMIPDDFIRQAELAKTSSGKIDLQKAQKLAENKSV